jgi:hypothetical protein
MLWIAWNALRSGGATRIEPRGKVSGLDHGDGAARLCILADVLDLRCDLTPFLSGDPTTVTGQLSWAAFMGKTFARLRPLSDRFSPPRRATGFWQAKPMQWLSWLTRFAARPD